MVKKGFAFRSGHFVVFYHVVLAISLAIYLQFKTPHPLLFVFMLGGFVVCGLGVTAGYHRFYAHRAYKMNKVAEAVFLLLGTWAVHGSVLRWAHDHRMHHWHTDKELDPYSIKKGFWYAHFWWMFNEDMPLNPKAVSDLLENKLVMFQNKHHGKLMLALNALSTFVFGLIVGDFAGAFVFAFLGRVFVTHHLTWFVNSLAHSWGSKEFSREQSAVNSWVVAFLTLGEGYHNYHHTFPNDYRNGVKWYQFDLTKWCIWLLSKVGLVWGLVKVDEVVAKKRLIAEDEKRLRVVLKARPSEWRSASELAESLRSKLTDLHALVQNYRAFKRVKAAKEAARAIKEDMVWLKKELQKDYAAWKIVCRELPKNVSVA